MQFKIYPGLIIIIIDKKISLYAFDTKYTRSPGIPASFILFSMLNKQKKQHKQKVMGKKESTNVKYMDILRICLQKIKFSV